MLKNQKNTFGLSKTKRMKAAIHGFTADEYVIYDLDSNDFREYIPEYERYVFREGMAEQRVLLDNKPVFYHLIKSFAPVNTLFAYQKDGRYVSLEPGWSKEEIPENLPKSGRIVLKKLSAGGGDGFNLLEHRDGRFFLNREECAKEDILRLLENDDFLLEEYCEQSGFEKKIWPYSVNTVRIITIMDSAEPAHAVSAIHRFGMDQHKCVDNVSTGGLYAEIDLKTGKMSAAVCRDKDYFFDENGKTRKHRCHPISGETIQGKTIPGWEKMIKSTESLHAKLAFTGIGLIAWDIAMTDDGYKVIEANTSSAMKLIQTFNGVRNTEIGAWMNRYR